MRKNRKTHYYLLQQGYEEQWEKEKEKEWEENASFWIKIIREQLDPFREIVTNKAVLSAINKDKNNKILDAGCGEGYFCRILAQEGHGEIFGVDSSSALIQAAKKLEQKQKLGINYDKQDFRSTDFPDSFFDIVVSYQTIHEIPDPQKALEEFSRILKVGGKLVLLFLHPCFDISPAYIEKDLPCSVFYFNPVKVERDYYYVGGEKSPHSCFYLHLPLSQWITLIKNQGFVLSQIREPRPPLDLIKEEKWWKNSFQHPRFILISSQKIQ
ncbi:MAG: methyltransferase domain-containing protein [Candidatus Nealsonbacteria bacterium]|nr:methyltransferase domain-containing protein [Candidatus Nealsonbacteria bacterium]